MEYKILLSITKVNNFILLKQTIICIKLLHLKSPILILNIMLLDTNILNFSFHLLRD